jgi:hypothetical protein
MGTLMKKARQIAREQGFKVEDVLHQGYYYTRDEERDVILGGWFNGQQAVLKVYNDKRVTRPARGHEIFNRLNRSTVIKAPHVFKYKEETAYSGWAIMTRIPKGPAPMRPAGLTTPLSARERRQFLEYFIEYRSNFDDDFWHHANIPQPVLRAELLDYMPPDVFHTIRLSRWLDLANKVEATRVGNRQKPLLDPRKFRRLFTEGLTFVTKHLRTEKMVLCHGHFTPPHLFIYGDEFGDNVWLTDFDHIGPRPVGYEIGLVVWSDVLMNMTSRTSLASVKVSIGAWMVDYLTLTDDVNSTDPAKRFSDAGLYPDDPLILRAALVERCMGALMADVVASDMERRRQRNMVRNLTELIAILLEPARANEIPGLEL